MAFSPISDMFSFDANADDDAKARRDQVSQGAISDMMNSPTKMAENSPAPASGASFDQNMKDISKDDPMMNSYYKSNPVEVAKAMYSLRKSLNGSGLGSVLGR